MLNMRMPKKTGKFYIPKSAFMSARYYALRYHEYIDRYRQLQSEDIDAIDYSKDRTDGGSQNSSVESKAIKMAELKEKIELIENTAVEAGGDIAKYVLKAVTEEDVPCWLLIKQYDMPCGKKMFYERRRKFYYLLSDRI